MMNLKTVMVVGTTLALLGGPGCKKKDATDNGGKVDNAAAKAATPAAAAPDLTALNASIPAAWKGKIEFAPRQLGERDDVMTAIVPKDWKQGFLHDEVDPPDGNSSFGFGTSMRIGATCGGMCKARTAAEYAASADKDLFASQLALTPPPKVIKDEKAPDQRVMVVEQAASPGNPPKTSVIIAWYKDNAERMYFCTVDLSKEAAELAPVFEKACLAAKK